VHPQPIATTLARFYEAALHLKPWGQELVFADGSAGYAGKIITVRVGHALSLQYHERKDETICVLSGLGLMATGAPWTVSRSGRWDLATPCA
jgi:mannose-6-phosphate isomerase-like protein (cupin superfamily)